MEFSCYVATRTLRVMNLHFCDINPKYERAYLQLRLETLEYAKTVNYFPFFIKRDCVDSVRRDCIEIFNLCESKAELYFFAFRLVHLYRDNKDLYTKVLVLFMVFFSSN